MNTENAKGLPRLMTAKEVRNIMPSTNGKPITDRTLYEIVQRGDLPMARTPARRGKYFYAQVVRASLRGFMPEELREIQALIEGGTEDEEAERIVQQRRRERSQKGNTQ
jgi:hypothetical protein